MARNRTIGIWAIIVGIVLNNMSYLIDLVKDHTGVIILGMLSLGGVVAGIALILAGMFMLVKSGNAGR